MLKRKKNGIYGRLFWNFILLSSIPIFLIGFVSFIYTREISLNSVKTELTSNIETSFEILYNDLKKYEDSLSLLSETPEIVDFFSGNNSDGNSLYDINQRMYLMIGGKTQELTIYLVNIDGRILHSTSDLLGTPEKIHTYWGVLRAAKQSNEPIMYPGNYDGKDSGMMIVAPVKSGSGIIGYTILDITPNAFARMFSSFYTRFPMKYFLIDRNYYLIYNEVNDTGDKFLTDQYRKKLKNENENCVTLEAEGEQKLLAVTKSNDAGMRLAAEVSISLVVASNKRLLALLIIVSMFSIMLCLYLAKRQSDRIVQPIRIMCDTMSRIDAGATDAEVPDLGEDEFGIMADSFNHMVRKLREQFKNNMEQQNRLRLAEIKNLKSQISPHFLYNTLDSIKYMARLGMNEEIDTMITKLGVLLHSGMNIKQDMIPLREEMKVVESYIAIQQIRYEGKFSFSIDIADELMDSYVPNLIVQPLVENAIVHGIEPKIGSGLLRISEQHTADDMIIEVYDNGGGIEEEKIASILSSDNSSKHADDRENIGLFNVNRRIQLCFGNCYGLSIQSKLGEYTKVCAHMPIVKEGDRNVSGNNC